MRLGSWSRRPNPSIDDPRIIVGARIRLDARPQPLGRRIQPVEIEVTDNGIDGTDAGHQLGRDHLGTGAVLGLFGEDKAQVRRKVQVSIVIVMIDPHRQSLAEVADELARRPFKRSTQLVGHKRHVEHRHPPLELAQMGQHPRRRKHQLHPLSRQKRTLPGNEMPRSLRYSDTAKLSVIPEM
jgi:hypothetical protein